MPLLEIAGLTKRFGGLTAVDGASLSVESGEILGLIGPNGSGKSTLLNMVSGIYRPTSGSVRLAGEEIGGLPAHRISKEGVARTFQQPRLLLDASVLHNVLVGTHNAGSRGFLGAIFAGPSARREEASLKERARHALEFVGLTHRAGVPASQLTAGETRLLSVARAIAAPVKLALLDEPAAGLNSAETDVLRTKLLELRDRGTAVILVDHDMPLVMQVASRVVVLNHGAVISTGLPAEVQADEAVIEAYLGRRAVRALQESRSA